MSKVHVYVTSAFSKEGRGGNKAGVVLDRPDLSDQEKMAISKVLGYSETAFVTQSDKADYRLEYFTPTEEVPLCGHATIATFATLQLLGKLTKASNTIETKAGILHIYVDEDGMVMMQQNAPQYYELLEKEEVAPSMGLTDRMDGVQRCDLLGEPIQIISTGLKDIILPVRDIQVLADLKPDFPAMTTFSREKQVVGVHAFAMPKGNSDNEQTVDAICRNFAPLYGIDEESATGTASCALAGYMAKYVNKKEIYVFEQGYSMDLPSRITVKVSYKEDDIDTIYVGGYGYLVEEKEI